MRKQLLLGAMVAGVVSVTAAATADEAKTAAPGTKEVECHGGNMCKGKGDCGGPGYSCAGNNKCIGKGFVNAKSQQECDKLVAKVKASIAKRNKKPAKSG